MIRTPEQYIESLRDGRIIYLNGERIPDITRHKHMYGAINMRARSYAIANDPRWRDLLTMEEKGERIGFLWNQPKTSEDLIRRRNLYITTMRMGGGISGMGPDALAAAGVVAARMDKQLGTHYTDALEDYRNHLKKHDPAITGAITDVKGNRSLRPSAQEQHKDFYVRVVDKQKDGIIVSGAKMHISDCPAANEIIVSPSRAHREEDKDYALVFATPLNAKGLKLLTSPRWYDETGEEARWNWPYSAITGGISECMIVFENVFVPWNRVFMCGEWQFSRDIAWTFGVFHRLFGTCHKVLSTEVTAGVASSMAEYNGTDKYPHIQEKLAWLAMHAEIINTMSRSACEHPDFFEDIGLAAPNMVLINIAKYMFANDQFETSKILCDITGGLVSTVHTYKDWMNPEERPILEKFFAAKGGIPAEDRLKMVRFAKDLTDHNHDNIAIHGEGSLAAQKMALFFGADWDRYKASARRIVGIQGWDKNPALKELIGWIPQDYLK
jgi:4-hydroxybutyryl-CoA dehydratase/vinylacetyl-CoA-Delta-isomerase